MTVVTDPEQSRLRPNRGAHGELPTIVPPTIPVAEATAAQLTHAALTGQLALGLAFLTQGRLVAAARTFASVRPADPVAVFYEAYVALLAQDYKSAASRASLSFELRPWQPAAAIAYLSMFELGRSDEADTFLGEMTGTGVEPAGAEWVERVQMLAKLAGAQALGRALESWRRAEALQFAELQARQEDWNATRQTLQPAMSDPTPAEAALDAEAAVRSSAADAAACVQGAEELLRTQPPNDNDAYEHLAAAYAHLGDADSAARHWRAYLEGAHPVEWLVAKHLAANKLGPAADGPEISAVNDEFKTRSSTDEAAFHARCAVDSGDLDEAADHLRRAEQLFPVHPPRHNETHLSLAHAYAFLGDAAGAAKHWRATLRAKSVDTHC